MQRLASKKPQYHLPLLEMLYHDQRPVTIMYQTIPHQSSIYILRVWNSDIHLSKHGTLWLGMMNELTPPHGLMTLYHRSLMSFKKLGIPQDIYGDSKQWQAKVFHIDKANIPKALHGYHWDGRVWLVKKP